jgi:site-specific DNA recombinase
MKAAIYSRKSRATEKGESVEHQINRGIAYCESKDWEYVVYCDYDFSGGYTKRPEFENMMKDIKSGMFDVLICYKLARVCRNVKDFSNFYDLLTQHGVSFVSLKENFDTTTSAGRASMYFSAVIAQMERENISEQVLDNMIDRAKDGKWNGGPVPVGYDVIKEEGKNIKGNKKITSKLIINSEESKLIELIYNEYLKPDGSIRGITKKLILLGYKTKNNKDWRDNQVNRILKNALYCIADEDAYNYFNNENNPIIMINDRSDYNAKSGLMYYGRRKPKNYTTTAPADKEDWILAVGEHEGIIPGKTFVEAQKKLSKNFARAPRLGTSTKSPLTGLVKCKKCKGAMTIVTAKVNKKADGYAYIYFECRKKAESSGLLCEGTRINARALEKRMLEHIKEVFTDKNKLDIILNDYNKQIKQNKADKKEIEKKKKSINKELKNTEKGIENLLNALAENILPAHLIKQKYAELEQKKEYLEDELSKLGLHLIDNEIKVNSNYVIGVLKELQPEDLDEINFDVRKNFYRSFIKNIYVDDETIEIKLFLSISNNLLVCNRKDMGSWKPQA